MRYVSLKVDPSIPTRVRDVIRRLEDPYLRDVRCMLRLPVPNYRLIVGCNFAISQVLTGAIGGLSTTLYRHSRYKGERFKGLLVDHYPWTCASGNIVSPTHAAEVIYSLVRNPLTHNLGLDLEKKAKTGTVLLKRLGTKINGRSRGLSERSIERLESTDQRFATSPTVGVRTDATVVLVQALYWVCAVW